MFVNHIIKCITRRYTFLHVYIQFSLALYKTETENYTLLCIKRERREWESGERDFWERDAWQIFVNVCYEAQLNQTLAIPFNLGY